ncbi:hypothetical protein CHUAL_014132 [Chamberlinius hualienensis]
MESSSGNVKTNLPILIPITVEGNAIFLEEDSEEENRCIDGKNKAKAQQFVEILVGKYSDSQFRETFRIEKRVFEYLYKNIGHSLNCNLLRKGRPKISADKQIMVALWTLANPGPFRTTSELFGVAKSTAWRCLFNVCYALIRLNHQEGIISWPTKERAQTIQMQFEEKYGFPDTIGAIDGMHIKIIAPKLHPESYINRKKFHAICLQAVCDSRMLFTDCYIGERGSVHNACVFKRSDLSEQMKHKAHIMFPNNSHIIGDAAYPLMENLMVPFKNTAALSDQEIHYNKVISSTRSIIKCAFSLLKRRLRKLCLLEMTDIKQMPIVIFACCIIHNLCILQGDDPSDLSADESESYSDDCDIDAEDDYWNSTGVGSQQNSLSMIAQKELGVLKRNRITTQL